MVIMNKVDYLNKSQGIINDIRNGVYEVKEDKTLDNLKIFLSFLYWNFKNYEHYENEIKKMKSFQEMKSEKLNVSLLMLTTA